MRPWARAASPAVPVLALAVAAALVLALWGALASRPQPWIAGGAAPLPLAARGADARILDVWVRWDAAPGPPRTAWVVLDPGDGAAPAAELVRRRQVHPGWNHLIWSELDALAAGRPLALRMSSPDARWTVAAPRYAPRYEARHFHALRGPLLALALVAGLAALALARRPPWPALRLRPWGVLVAASMAVGLALRLRSLTSHSLWFDEVLTAIGAQSVAWVLYTPQVFGHPPLQYMAGWLAEGVAGGLSAWLGGGAGTHDDGTLRLPFALAGTATVGAVAFLGRRLAGPAAGAVAAWLLAVSPFHVELSQLARPWVGLVLLAVLSTHALVRALDDGRARGWAWFAGLTALAAYTQYLALPLLAVQVLALAIGLAVRRGRGWAPALASLALLAVLLLPLADVARPLAARHIGTGAVPPRAMASLVTDVLVPHFLGGGATALIGLGCLALGAWSLRRRSEVLALAVAWLVGPLALMWAAQPLHFLAGRHLAVLLPMMLVLVGRGADVAGRRLVRLARLGAGVLGARATRGRAASSGAGPSRNVPGSQWPLRRQEAPASWRRPWSGPRRAGWRGTRPARWRAWPARAVSAALAVALTATHASDLGAYYEARRGPDWRTIAAVLDRVVEPGDQVVASLGAVYPLRHYWRRDAVSEMDRAALPTEAAGTRVWLVTLVLWDDDPALHEWLETRAVRVGEVPGSWSQPGVRIHRLRTAR